MRASGVESLGHTSKSKFIECSSLYVISSTKESIICIKYSIIAYITIENYIDKLIDNDSGM